MEIITGTALSEKVDYNFGDQMGAIGVPHIKGGFMKDANAGNTEFLEKCKQFEGKVMTLFIDNIRLYNRGIWANDGFDAEWIAEILKYNDLLALCKTLPNNKFVIFCSHEDTPITDDIVVPDNVLGIHAVNAPSNHPKVHPFPYGLQRELGENDNRVKIMGESLKEKVKPTKLLYINCGIERNAERKPLVDFSIYSWVTTRFDKDSKYFPYERYKDFLNELRDHKFMVCPQGHGMDCHRNWESLYMRRVPVMKEHPYFRRLMKGFPCLFVDEWSEINENLLEDNDVLYEQAQNMSFKYLDLDVIFKAIVESYA